MGGSSSKEDDHKKESEAGEEDKKPVNHLKEMEQKKRLREIQTPNQGLQAACVQGDADAVRKYVAPTDANGKPIEGGGADVNHRDLGPVPPEGKKADDPEFKAMMKDVIITEDYPLHMAAENGHVKICELLFYLDAKLENRNRMGSTALHRAVSAQKIDVVKWLLEKKCDIMAKNNIGNYALHIASYMGNVEIARLLLEAGAHRQIRTANRVEMSPLDYARKAGMIELLTRWRPDGSWGHTDSKSGESKSHELKHGESLDTVSDPIAMPTNKHVRTNSGSTSNSSVAISVLSEGGFPVLASTPNGASMPLSGRASNAPSPLPTYLHPSHTTNVGSSSSSAPSSPALVSLPGSSDSATTTSRGASSSTAPVYAP